MATLRNKKKLAAVSRETTDSSRGSRGRNVLDPELTLGYISQVSEEIEGRVTRKLSKEFNKTEVVYKQAFDTKRRGRCLQKNIKNSY